MFCTSTGTCVDTLLVAYTDAVESAAHLPAPVRHWTIIYKDMVVLKVRPGIVGSLQGPLASTLSCYRQGNLGKVSRLLSTIT
jgi:hypothetical protein